MAKPNRHEEIRNKFKELNDKLEDKKYKYLEEISSIINKTIKNYEDKKIQKTSYDNIVNLFYAALTDTYLETTIALKNIYNEISDEIPDIEDFIYKDDKKTLPERIKQYWDEAFILLKNPQADSQEIALYLLTMYERILNNEMINVKAGVKKVKKPINDDGIEVIVITDGECCNNGGIYLADEAPQEPPYHINCECDSWHDFYYPTDEADLEELQELGWEEEDE